MTSNNYWLFLIMYNQFSLSYWRKMAQSGLAAQHYPSHIALAAHNINKLNQLKKGDWIVAAFRNRRFAGYGKLKSDFYRSNKSLNIKREGDKTRYEFAERFLCSWRAIPFDHANPYVECNDLKSQKAVDRDIVMTRGFCVKKISKRTFEILKARLDEAGAIKIPVTTPLKETSLNLGDIINNDLINQDYFEGKKYSQYGVKYERDPNLRKIAIMIHGTKCKVCGFDFEEIYGDQGKGFIEVHHIKPVSTFGAKAKVNPKKELTVVCSNCHRMIHRRKEYILSVSEMKQLIQ